MKFTRIFLSVVVMFAVACCVDAADAAKKANKAKKGGTAGVIEKVDTSAKTITVKVGKKNDANAPAKTLTLTEQTKYSIQTADGVKEGKAADISVGKRVKVVTETKEGKEVASSVTVVEAKKK
jgi:hypothetical protein